MSVHHTREEAIQVAKEMIDMEIALGMPTQDGADNGDDLPSGHLEFNCPCGAEVIKYRGYEIHAHRGAQ